MWKLAIVKSASGEIDIKSVLVAGEIDISKIALKKIYKSGV